MRSGFSIRSTVMLYTLAPMLVIATLVCAWFVNFRIEDLDEALNQRGISTARQLAVVSEYALLTGNRNQLAKLASTLLRREGIRSVSIYDSKRQLLTHQGPQPLEPGTLIASLGLNKSIYRTEHSFRYAVPVLLGADNLINDLSPAPDTTQRAGTQPLGWGVVELRRDSTESAKLWTATIAMLATLATIVLNFSLARHLTRRLADPVREITRAVHELGGGRLQTRVQVEGGPEIDRLQEGINTMAEALQRLRSELQQNIDQATEDLRETLETIEIQNIELDIARKNALEASRVKSEFLANMSHEIRTPLNGIMGFTRLLLKSQTSRQQRDQLQTIMKSSEILLTIINDVLDFSKIEAGKLVLDYTRVNIRDIVDDVLTMLAPSAHEKNLDLAALVYVDVPRQFYGDPLRIKQVLTNLINNAIKFTATGEVMLRVMIEDEGPEGKCRIRFTITDTGVGLSRLQQQSLFTAFSQADASTARRHGGTGLGLVICRRITEQMHGNIGVESELGKGSTFWFEIPVESPAEDEESALEHSLFQGQRIIYLEQQVKTGLVVESLLRLWGAEVQRVTTRSELESGIRSAQEDNNGFALAILGVGSLQMQSPGLHALVHNIEYNFDCRLLILHPTLDASLEEPAFFGEASASLTKPPTFSRLRKVVSTLLFGHDAEPAPPEAAAESHPEATPVRPGLARPGSVARILAVDDNPANLKLVITLLQEAGVDVHGASNGYDAVRCVRQQTFDLVFMDVQMPGMDGIETTAKLRELENGAHIPVVALTAHALSEEKSLLMNSGFDGFLTKPIDEKQLLTEINRLTGHTLTQDSSERQSESPPSRIKPSAKGLSEATVDIPESIRLAGNKADLAEELFSMLLESLPEAMHGIGRAHERQQTERLLEEVHRLHGATRYCGVPALRDAAARLETTIKRTPDKASPLVRIIQEEAERLLYWAERNDWQTAFRQLRPSRR